MTDIEIWKINNRQTYYHLTYLIMCKRFE